MRNSPPADVVRLAGLFALSGTMHFVRPQQYERIVPHVLPRQRELVYVSGACELACAAGLMLPRTRRLAGLASAVLASAPFVIISNSESELVVTWSSERREAHACSP